MASVKGLDPGWTAVCALPAPAGARRPRGGKQCGHVTKQKHWTASRRFRSDETESLTAMTRFFLLVMLTVLENACLLGASNFRNSSEPHVFPLHGGKKCHIFEEKQVSVALLPVCLSNL